MFIAARELVTWELFWQVVNHNISTVCSKQKILMNLLSYYTFQGVNCMRQNTVEMTVTIIQSTTTHDLTTIGWTKGYVMNNINKEKFLTLQFYPRWPVQRA